MWPRCSSLLVTRDYVPSRQRRIGKECCAKAGRGGRDQLATHLRECLRWKVSRKFSKGLGCPRRCQVSQRACPCSQGPSFFML